MGEGKYDIIYSMKICMTGGIACGKSLATEYLRAEGYEVLDADDVVHELEEPGGAAVEEICAAFEEVRTAAGGVDRKKLASIVFNDEKARQKLGLILNNKVKERIEEFFAEEGAKKICVIPLLFELQWEQDYDIILCVASKRETQISRMMATRGYSRAEAEARLAAQIPVEQKAKLSDYTIHNDGSADALRAQIKELKLYERRNCRVSRSSPTS